MDQKMKKQGKIPVAQVLLIIYKNFQHKEERMNETG